MFEARHLKTLADRKYVGSILLAVLVLVAASGRANAVLDSSGFGYRLNIRIDGYSQSEVLTNFPLLVRLGTNITGFQYNQFLSPGAADLRFVSDSGIELNYEIDTWNPVGDSYVWVQVPALTGSETLITAYWGKAGLTTPAYTANGATWSNGYLGVWHLNQPNAVNSVNGSAGTAHGNTTTNGMIGSSQFFALPPGNNNYIQVGNLKATNYTLSAWTRNTYQVGYDKTVFLKQNSFLWEQWNIDYNLNQQVFGSSGNQYFQAGGNSDLDEPSWSYEVVTYDSTTGIGSGYMNGNLANGYPKTNAPIVPNANDNICIVGSSGGSHSYYGRLDEFQLSSVVRSAAWLKASYQNQLTPATFMTCELSSKLAARPDSGTNLVLTWLGAGLVLQVSPTLGPGASWSTNGLPAPVVSNGVYRVTLPCNAAAALYRLAPNVTATTPGSPYTWPVYSPNLNYDFRTEYPNFPAPTNVLNDCAGVQETIASGWWCFRYGSNKNPVVTSAAWNPMLVRMNSEFAYFRDVMGWPPDKRAKRGYYSSIYLYGSGLCTDNAPNTATGGWMGSINYQGENWPMVLLSYVPVWSFDPAYPNGDTGYQQGGSVHEGVHSVLADMPGCRNAGWFHEGGNNWLQSAAAAQKTGNFNSLGWLSAGAMIAPFMPIECYSGWLQDGSFGGPSAEGVNMFSNSTQICTWRNLLGGNQYGECFPTFMGEIVSQGSVAWIWQNCPTRVLEGLATASSGLGPSQTRRLIKEYRARQAMCDFARWTPAYKALLNNNWGADIHAEWDPKWIDCGHWYATCYVVTTNNAGTLTPEQRTLPGWSGANQIPLTVSGTGTVSVNFQPIGANMSCQLVYRATDGSVVYSVPVSSGTCSLTLPKAVKNNVVIAVICNTDYTFTGNATRSAKYDYRLTLGSGVTGTASTTTKWWN